MGLVDGFLTGFDSLLLIKPMIPNLSNTKSHQWVHDHSRPSCCLTIMSCTFSFTSNSVLLHASRSMLSIKQLHLMIFAILTCDSWHQHAKMMKVLSGLV